MIKNYMPDRLKLSKTVIRVIHPVPMVVMVEKAIIAPQLDNSGKDKTNRIATDAIFFA